MTNFINKINQYLLERFPISWNTKVLWMVLIALGLHLLFFLYGYLSLSNPVSLQNYDAEDVFFTQGGILISIISSILLMVFWLIMMFRNNAFKSYYPTRAWDLVKQFGAYFIIIFVSISFYFSFQTGLKIYINTTYNDHRFEKDIEAVNRAAMFFSHNIYDYQLNNKKYPIQFQEIYCEVVEDDMDYSKSIIKSSFDDHFQFYSLKTLVRNENKDEYIDSIYDRSLFNESAGVDLKRYFFKDKVVDVTASIITAQPSYYHYSTIFYQKGITDYMSYSDYTVNYEDNNYNKEKPQFSALKSILVQKNYELLLNNNPQEIKKVLSDFLSIATTYEIKNNLNLDQWFKMIYHPQNFEIKALIHPKESEVIYGYGRIYDENDELSPLQEYAESIDTKSYINTQDLKQSLSNIHKIKESKYVLISLNVFLWVAFFIGLFIFMFRLTGLKSLLFSVITAGVLGIFITLIYIFSYTGFGWIGSSDFFALYLIFIVGTFILLGTIFFMPKMNKMISSIFLNLTMVGFLPYILLILAIITMHQENACRDLYPNYIERREKCFILLESLGVYWSFIFMAIAVISLWWLCKKALTWKALPEG